MKWVCKSVNVISGERFYRGCIETRPDASLSMRSGYIVVQPLLGPMKPDVTFGSGNKVISALPFSLVVNKSILDKDVHSKDEI